MPPRTLIVAVLSVVALMLGATIFNPPARGHTEVWPPFPPPGPPPPPSSTQVQFTPIKPLRWSWVHWWESNRWRYLEPLRQAGPGQQASAQALEERRAAVLEILAMAIRADHVPTRLAAVQAYGRMRDPAGVRPLVDLIDREPDMLVRMVAATSLGTIGTPESQRLILAANYPDDATFAAAVIGLGLAERLLPASEQGLRGLTGRAGIVGDAAIWALGQHGPGTADVSLDVVRSSPSVWEVAESLIDLGQADDAASGRMLAAVATNPAQRNSGIKVERTLYDVAVAVDRLAKSVNVRPGSDPTEGVSFKSYLVAVNPIFASRPDLDPMVQGWEKYRVPVARTGYVAMVRGRLRGAATIGMGQRSDDGTARAILAVSQGNARDPFQHLPIGMALIAIGERGLEGGLDRVLSIVDAPEARRMRNQELLDSPLRGFGAIGLGLYARPVETPQGIQNNPGWERCVQVLQQRAADPNERAEVRSAAAIALGLTRRTEVLRGFGAINESLNAGDLPLAGFVVLSRSMLGDGSAIRDATSLLDAAPHRDELVDTMTRRAAVVALGVSGRRETLGRLVQAWHEGWFVSREVQRSLALLGGVGVIDELLAQLPRETSPDGEAYVIDTLGQLMARGPRGLDAIGEGRMFAMRHELFGQYRSLANPFLYGSLIRRLEDEENESWR
ncbi:MAG: HEAT repeat domain-containing protein [Phycisphaerales bacterium]